MNKENSDRNSREKKKKNPCRKQPNPEWRDGGPPLEISTFNFNAIFSFISIVIFHCAFNIMYVKRAGLVFLGSLDAESKNKTPSPSNLRNSGEIKLA